MAMEVAENAIWENALKRDLPDGYKYELRVAQPLKLEFCVTDVTTADGATTWLSKYSDVTKTTWRCNRQSPSSLMHVLHKVHKRCHHNTFARSETADARSSSKNTRCPARVRIAVKSAHRRNKEKAHCLVTFMNCHNHPVDSYDALSKRDVSAETRAKLLELFADGYGPTAAVNTLKFDLQQTTSDLDYARISADRAIIPDIGYALRLHRKAVSKADVVPDTTVAAMELKASTMLAALKADHSVLGATERVGDGLVAGLVSPLMLRAHALACSGEETFLDATGTGHSDRNHCRVFLLMATTTAGGVPLGAFVCTSECVDVIAAGLRLITRLAGPSAFAGRGPAGPVHVMTADSDAAGSAVGVVWPAARRLLCTRHVGHTAWRWLGQSANSVAAAVRADRMRELMELVLATDAESLQRRYEERLEAGGRFAEYLRRMMTRKEEWAHSHRAVRHHTNEHVASAFRILMGTVLKGTRSYNVALLLEFLAVRMDRYYTRRFVEAASGKLGAQQPPDDSSVSKISDYEYVSRDADGRTHRVHVMTKLCECEKGLDCPAVDISSVYHDFHSQKRLTLDERIQFHALSTGGRCEIMWLQPLEEEPVEMEEEIEMVEWATEMLEETTGVTEGETETQGVRCVEMAGGASGMAEGDTVKQRVTVAGHALAESMKRMICRSTPGEELLAAIRELQGSVDAVVTTSEAIDLLRSMAQKGYL